ncbi:hypothetical protein EY643_02420 [Halioglobus maricola]|uniref:Serine kinase n=1 Tax=Halioglobus maricola TaxID=2601894 RepID=A0A5P9NHW5_9GAMM|nr:hypothetical protein [Halioglobus maricola]QFU74598.1 hypothetical protein EY643_02420 [Halioglobus maricola]
MSAPYHYRFFDAELSSEIELPALGTPAEIPQASSESKAVAVRLAAPGLLPEQSVEWYPLPTLEDTPAFLRVGTVGDHYLLRCDKYVDFRIGPSLSEVVVHPAPDLPEHTLSHLLLDQALPALFGQRGRLVLHASAVRWQDRALVFVGESTWGKSTLAASYGDAGGYLADDAVLLQPGADGQVLATASYPGARLWPESFDALLGEDARHEQFAHYANKRRHTPRHLEREAPLPLAGIFLINDPYEAPAEQISTAPLRGQEMLLLMLRRAFALHATDPALMQALLQQAGSVARSGAPVRALSYPRRHELLPEVREKIAAEIAQGPME